MTGGEFVLAIIRLAAILLPALMTAHGVRRRYLGAGGAIAVLVEAVLAVSVLLVAAEVVGVLSLERFWALVAALALVALATLALTRREPAPRLQSQPREPARLDAAGIAAVVSVTVVGAQWLLQTADALGGGMLNFDTLWYHMPFAARFVQTGSIAGIQFTQADPFTAYYPANSELLHAVGIVALHNDFLSPLLNLLWLGVALLAAWCIGTRWEAQRLTLCAGALAMSLPVLSTTQPGEAFNDIVGVAMLLAAVALVAYPNGGALTLISAGLALGLAVGTKYTFLVPALLLAAGVVVSRAPGSRARVLGLLGVPAVLTGAWWYLRNTIDVGNPLGLRMSLGPITLPGPSSPLANASQQTVFSELRHISLWSSRFAPGLDHALGPLWPLILFLYPGVIIVGLTLVRDRLVRVLALTTFVAGVSYLFLPTGATGIEHGTTLFQVNLRYATPALALGLLLVPVIVTLRVPRAIPVLGPALAALVILTQFEHSLWPSQTARHLVFVLATAALAVLIWRASKVQRGRLAVLTAAAVLALFGAFVAQRHYFNRRYLVGETSAPGLGAIYRWAQTVADSRIALYGTVEQYPLYGARDTNWVDYLGVHTPSGGFSPTPSCASWRSAITRGRYR